MAGPADPFIGGAGVDRETFLRLSAIRAFRTRHGLLAGLRLRKPCRRIERVADRLFEGEEAVLHVMGWVGRPRRRGSFVDGRLLGPNTSPTLELARRIQLTSVR